MNRPPRITLTRMSVPYALWALHFVALYSLQGLACALQLVGQAQAAHGVAKPMAHHHA